MMVHKNIEAYNEDPMFGCELDKETGLVHLAFADEFGFSMSVEEFRKFYIVLQGFDYKVITPFVGTGVAPTMPEPQGNA